MARAVALVVAWAAVALQGTWPPPPPPPPSLRRAPAAASCNTRTSCDRWTTLHYPLVLPVPARVLDAWASWALGLRALPPPPPPLLVWVRPVLDTESALKRT